EGAQRAAYDEGSGATMRDQLRLLKDRDHRCVIMVRKIQSLGFSAPELLAGHFETFGPVQDVLVPQSQARSCKSAQSVVRQRPAHLGFVIMASAASAEAAFAEGAEHIVEGSAIILEPFDEARWQAGADRK
ncbi:unnamed protein product, partial [Prorocentrum cordatum]